MTTGLRTALVALDGSAHSDSASALAIDWARRAEARLLGLGILAAPSIDRPEPVSLGGGAFKRSRDEARLVDAHRRVLGFLEDFKGRTAAGGVTAEVLEEVGDPAELIAREAQRCDIVVIGRQTHFRFETQDEPDATLAGLLHSSPRPLVIVPRELLNRRGILVAYGGGREAARTLQTFQLLGLAFGDEIDVVTVQRDRAQAEAVLRLARDFLAAHATPYRLHPIASHAAPADVLLDEVRQRRPRLLVMGAHGHHGLRDVFATSVARAVLGACPVPVLIGA